MWAGSQLFPLRVGEKVLEPGGIFPAKHLLAVWHAAAFTYRTVCNGSRREVASALNRLADRAFLNVLSPRDKSSMADLIADVFAKDTQTNADSEEEEPGN